MNLLSPLLVGPAPAALRLPGHSLPGRPLVGAVHLRRFALVLATLALACLGAVVSDRSARPNGPLAWHAAAPVIGDIAR